ncbi:MAG: nitrate reductase molybdenum cofactor assembly chaperone [Acidobacteriota bacterium]
MYGALADLLDYPGPDLPARAAAFVAGADGPAAQALAPFAEALHGFSQGEMEEIYTRTFDLQPETCLYIGHQLFGEDWRRSMFMARLKHRYGEHGFSCGAESPDFLPVVLRFLNAEPQGPETEELLQQCVIPAAARLLRLLEEKSNPYAAVLRALLRYAAPDGIHNPELENLSCRPSSSSFFPILL